MPIRNLHKIEQPRERLTKYGPEKLSNTELLAILLRTGPTGMNVLELSKRILQNYKGVSLANATLEELVKVRGIGLAKAAELIASFELSRRLLKDKISNLLLSPQDVWSQLKDIRDNKKEHFVIFFLDTQHQEIKREIISVGTLSATVIHPREVFEPAIRHLSAHIILAHNHPSGSLEPSNHDLALTERLVQVGQLIGIGIMDHIIVTKTGYFSLKEHNYMNLT